MIRRLLLLGGTGFVGTAIREGLGAHLPDTAVRCLVRPRKAPRALSSQTEVVAGDVLNPVDLERAADGCDAIVNAVGIIAETGRTTFKSIHIDAVVNTLSAAKKQGIARYLLISALGTHKDAVSRYHQTKFRGEELLRSSGLNYTILRPSAVFGIGDKFINLLARIVRVSPLIPVVGPGRNRFQPVFVDDLARMVYMSLAQGIGARETIAVGGAKHYGYNDIIELLKRLLRRDSKPVLHLPMPLVGFFARYLGIPLNYDQWLMLQEDNVLGEEEFSHLEQEFGFRPSSLEEALPTYLQA